MLGVVVVDVALVSDVVGGLLPERERGDGSHNAEDGACHGPTIHQPTRRLCKERARVV
jgi:hypothetical protein